MSLFQKAFAEAEVVSFKHTKAWDDFSFDKELEDLTTRIKSLQRGDILVLLGFGWHSRGLHGNPMCRYVIQQTLALVIGVYQESYGAKSISHGLIAEMKEASLRSFGLIDIAIYNHYRDFCHYASLGLEGRLRKLGILYLPFLNPFQAEAYPADYLAKRLSKVVFVGKAELYGGANPYYLRSLVLDEYQHLDNCDLFTPQDGQHIDHQEYRQILQKYRFAFVAPSIDSSLTVRPIEACSCGAIPIIPKPRHKEELEIYVDNVNCFYYEPLHELGPQINKILAKTPADLDLIAQGCLKMADSLSPHGKIAATLREYINKFTLVMDNSCIVEALYPSAAFSFSTLEESFDFPKIAIDLVFFQFSNTGIARVWDKILTTLSQDPIREHIVLLVRQGSKFFPEMLNEFETLTIPSYDYEYHERDSLILDWACEQACASVLTSTYMTYSASYSNISLIHDCIPERISKRQLWEAMWKAKQNTLLNSTVVITISAHSLDEIKSFYPETRGKPLILAPNTIREVFTTSAGEYAHKNFRETFCLLVGERQGYLGYKNGRLALEGVKSFNQSNGLVISVKATGGWRSDDHPLAKYDIEPDLYEATDGVLFQRANYSDDELLNAYRECLCLLYLSEDEGFGLPIFECLASGGYVLALDRKYLNDFDHPRLFKIKTPSVADISDGIGQILRLSQKVGSNNVNLAWQGASEIRSDNEQALIVSEVMQLCQSFSVTRAQSGILSARLITNQSISSKDLAKQFLYSHPCNANREHEKHEPVYDLGFLTSTYNSGRFFDQLLENLQEISDASAVSPSSVTIESIIIDSDSPGDEIGILLNKIGKLNVPIKYYKTPYRETLYRAWNRASLASSSRYITNANTDDRHSPYFAYVMTLLLDANPLAMLAYPDQLVVENANQMYAKSATMRRWAWPSYSYAQLLTGNHVGSTPVWRSELTAKVGLFWERFKCAADWEYWLRIATQKGSLVLMNLPMSSYLFNPTGIEHGDPVTSLRECEQIQFKYQTFGEYSVSENDLSKGSEHDGKLRRIEDMQYSGIVASKPALIVIPSLEPTFVVDIAKLGSFASNVMPALMCLDGTIGVLPEYLSIESPRDLCKFYNYDEAIVYLHVNSLTMVHSGLAPSDELNAFLLFLYSHKTLASYSSQFGVIENLPMSEIRSFIDNLRA